MWIKEYTIWILVDHGSWYKHEERNYLNYRIPNVAQSKIKCQSQMYAIVWCKNVNLVEKDKIVIDYILCS